MSVVGKEGDRWCSYGSLVWCYVRRRVVMVMLWGCDGGGEARMT